MVYTVDWSTGFIGNRTRVYVGTSKNIDQAIKEAISKVENLKPEQIKIVKKTKVKGSKSFGIGTPQSSRDY